MLPFLYEEGSSGTLGRKILYIDITGKLVVLVQVM